MKNNAKTMKWNFYMKILDIKNVPNASRWYKKIKDVLIWHASANTNFVIGAEYNGKRNIVIIALTNLYHKDKLDKQ